jgi:hypothetical protein
MLAMIARKDNIANTSVNGAYVLGELSTLMQNDTQCVGSPFVLVIPWSKYDQASNRGSEWSDVQRHRSRLLVRRPSRARSASRAHCRRRYYGMALIEAHLAYGGDDLLAKARSVWDRTFLFFITAADAAKGNHAGTEFWPDCQGSTCAITEFLSPLCQLLAGSLAGALWGAIVSVAMLAPMYVADASSL